MQNVLKIPLDLLDEFPSFPFRVKKDSEFLNLLASISEHGVLQPIIVRQVGNRYQIISGHRRKYVCEILQYDSIPAIVCECEDPEAILLMLDSNIQQRQSLLPSEKAFAYKMRMDVLNSAWYKSRKQKASNREDSNQLEDCRVQLRQFGRLNYLVPELLEFVDYKFIALRPAIELSYLDEDSQRDVVDFIDENESTPSHGQTVILRKLFKEGSLTREKIYAVLSEPKGNQREKISINLDKIRSLIPEGVPASRYEDYIFSMLGKKQNK